MDGYRAIAVTSAGNLNLFSRRRNSFNRQYPLVFEALAELPDNTVIDGEIVALDESGRPDFGYVPGTHGLDSVIVGYYRRKDLIYVARVRNGFVPASRREVFEKLRPLVRPNCPFVNLPETHKGRWGDGLTTEDMKKCIWVRPELVAQIEFLAWTESDHLRHSKFAGLREDKDARSVVQEQDVENRG